MFVLFTVLAPEICVSAFIFDAFRLGAHRLRYLVETNNSISAGRLLADVVLSFAEVGREVVISIFSFVHTVLREFKYNKKM